MSCSKENCPKKALFNYARLQIPKFCEDHKLLYMIDITNNHCLLCIKRPIYNYKTEKQASHCAKHKLTDMVNIITKKCVVDYCMVGAVFNYKEEPIGFFCCKHKTEEMIDVFNKVCEYENCTILASYNFKDQKAKYCKKHIEPNMINVHDNLCIYENCLTIANYSEPGGKKSLYCFKHKKEGMINRKRASCIAENCKTTAVFNYIGELVPIYCAKHKLEKMVDIHGKICEFEGCYTHPGYNYEGLNARFCSPHKLEGMVLVTGTCIIEKCNISAKYNLEGLPAQYCSSHKSDEMINVCVKRCHTPLCDVQVGNKNDGYCIRCYIYMFPDKPVSVNYKTKERTVVQFIYQHFPLTLYTWINDKRVSGGCSLRRPDLMLDLGYQVIMIEIDENGHGHYDELCDHRRTMELSQDIGHRPIIFIRFNPDSYKVDGVKIPSCWYANKLGLDSIKHVKDWDNRLTKLKLMILYWLNHKSEKTIHTEYLFFDQ